MVRLGGLWGLISLGLGFRLRRFAELGFKGFGGCGLMPQGGVRLLPNIQGLGVRV